MYIKIKTWNIEKLTGYKPLTTMYQDFSIADNFGNQAIIDTYENLISLEGICHANYKYMTELVMVLNHKIWEHFEKDETKARVYDNLWRQAQEIVYETFNKEELLYYYNITD